ncbi:alcohol oxidase [Agrocybe pediades]|nr:alcohol oxidase [Agrocybe pediades]
MAAAVFERGAQSVSNTLETLLKKVDDSDLGHLIGDLTPTSRALISGAVIVILVKLCFGKPKERRKYITDLSTVGKPVERGQNLVSADAPVYDVIIVGGGTAGCVLAARLSEDPTMNVLLLESGGSGRALSESRIPAAFTKLYRLPEHVHNFWTEAQEFAKGKKKFWPRARMLGGCSSINAQMAQYGPPGDFDEWATIIGDESWAYKNFSKYIRKFEKFIPHRDYPEVDASVHGTTGPVQVGFNTTVSGWCSRFIKACTNAGIPSTHDFNAPKGLIGAARVMTYVNTDHERVSSENAYLTPQVLARPNLKVAIKATVTRILFEESGNTKVATGVEFTSAPDGPLFHARSKKDVIVCGGAVQSPHILMLSGIGPAAHLQFFGIPVIHDLPGVGQNLVDHPIVDLYLLQKGYIESFRHLGNPKSVIDILKVIHALLQYHVFNTGGPLAMNHGEAAAFVRTDDPSLFPPSEFPEKLLDSTLASDSPDLEYFTTPGAYLEHGAFLFPNYHTYGIHVYLLRPTSRGTVLLNSVDPFAHPKVDPNYLATREDVLKLVRGIRLGLKISHSEPLNSLLDHSSTADQFDHQLHLKTDAELEEIVRERVETVYHPTSTCRMAPLYQGGVVDSNLKVYGVKGLRVCDASVFPSIISGHTAGACFAVAEKLADEIRAEYGSQF